ncbi:hypothetical protein LTR56_021163 [Elasticomyces elasticus]|nr:hypothetical protein LTR56_021163 [Elasticomyces elasticus]KAK3631838.1 hypothetical protein LTR22_020906 [Elasticomyces elasticus]KAK4909694.1 hypothetical protein LTR49_021588 [Elasticomyces elasticus]KAK5749556.1 hypothetical protein LTS12_020422 [Elasticomyces elasticus]
MEWESTMGLYQYKQPAQQEEGEIEDDVEDFYGENNNNGETMAGAAEEADGDAGDLLSSLLPKEPEAPVQVQAQQKAPTPPTKPEHIVAAETAAARKAENQRQADLLRAKLLAKRQNTPMKNGTPQLGTPAKAPIVPQMSQNTPQQPVQTPAKAPVVPQMVPQQPAQTPTQPKAAPESANDVFGPGNGSHVVSSGPPAFKSQLSDLNLDDLIADAQRTVKVNKAAEQSAAQANGHAAQPVPTPVNNVKPVNARPTPPPTNVKPVAAPKPVETPKAPARSLMRPSVQVQEALVPAEKVQHPKHLTDVYYADLAAWLEFTGYHDVEYRNSKLQKHKERKALEAEAAKIQEQLDRLRREEEDEMQALRSSVAHATPASKQAAPALPSTMPSGDAAIMAGVANGVLNGIKRPHSPTPTERNNKRRDEPSANGFRIRGANDSPTDASAIERRISYPDARRRSLDATKSRDPSLERRQAYYNRDGERAAPRAYDAYEPGRAGARDSYGGRGGGAAGYQGRGGGYGREYSNPTYRGNAAQTATGPRRSGR